MKRFIPVIVFIAAAWMYQQFPGTDESRLSSPAPAADVASPATGSRSSASFVDGRPAQGAGTVVRILPDDNDGSRHQRFILRLASGRTLLIAHNIDLAPRIEGIREGDQVEFFGEYRSNDRGGVIHWTHRDPQGHHPGGWLRHLGRTYQ